MEFWRLQEKPQLEFTKAFPPTDMLISPSQCLTSNVWIFPSLSFISIKTEGSSTLLRELQKKKTVWVMPLFMMSNKQSLRLFFPLYNAYMQLVIQIIRSTYKLLWRLRVEQKIRTNYLRKIVTNSRKYDHVKCSTFVQVQLATCQTAFISERLKYGRKVFNQIISFLLIYVTNSANVQPSIAW